MARSTARLLKDLERLEAQQVRLNGRRQLLVEKIQAAGDREARARSARRLARRRNIPTV